MKSLTKKLKSASTAPIKIISWLFRHSPLFTTAELFALSVTHIIFIHTVNFFLLEKLNPVFINVVGGVLGLLSVIFSSFVVNDRNEVEDKFEVNNYDVLSLTVNEYLSSRGTGIFLSYVFGGVIGFVLIMLAAITVILWKFLSMLYGT